MLIFFVHLALEMMGITQEPCQTFFFLNKNIKSHFGRQMLGRFPLPLTSLPICSSSSCLGKVTKQSVSWIWAWERWRCSHLVETKNVKSSNATVSANTNRDNNNNGNMLPFNEGLYMCQIFYIYYSALYIHPTSI